MGLLTQQLLREHLAQLVGPDFCFPPLSEGTTCVRAASSAKVAPSGLASLGKDLDNYLQMAYLDRNVADRQAKPYMKIYKSAL